MNKSMYTVTVPAVNFFVGNRIPNAMAAALSNATYKGFTRIVGGMSNNGPIYRYFDTALAGMNGFAVWSGATRFEEEGRIAESVAEVVTRAGEQHPDLITMGSCPRTAPFQIRGESHLFVGDNVIINPGTRWVATIQNGAENGIFDGTPGCETEGGLGWNGDLPAYFQFMVNARALMGFELGVTVYNAGGVSVEEALMAREYDIPVFVVEGSGRHCDPMFKSEPGKLSPAVFSGPDIHHVGMNQSKRLRELLRAYGLSN